MYPILRRFLLEHFLYYRLFLLISKDNLLATFRKDLKIFDSYETVRHIIDNNYSVSRFGDGEFALLAGKRNGFQFPNPLLAERLKEVLTSEINNLIVCIPFTLKDWSFCRFSSKLFAAGFCWERVKDWVIPFIHTDRIYGDSLFTRFYMMKKDKSQCGEYVSYMKQIWNNRDLLIVEGEKSRLGVGNDLFSNAKSIKRILCPNENAFDKYNEILELTLKHCDNRLVILALGMTATVLAYDLTKNGIRALDLGHVDVEYEWMLMGAKEKCAIPGKMMAEVKHGKNPEDVDSSSCYYQEVLARVK